MRRNRELAGDFRGRLRFAEREMTVAEETEDDGEDQDDGAGDVGSGARVSSLPPDEGNQEGKSGGRKDHAAGIDADAADPFAK